MKTLSCDLCDFTAEGKTFEEWMDNLKPHYAQAHADFMKMQEEKSPEEQQKEMQAWVAANKMRFEQS